MSEYAVNPWKTVSSRRIYENAWFCVREDNVIRPDGETDIYSVVELPASVGVVAIYEQGDVQLAGQWRYCLERFSWEIPTGFCGWDEEPLAAANRELEEETGLRAGRWQSLGSIDNNNAVTTDQAHLFLATDLQLGASHTDPAEKIICKRIPFDLCVAQVVEGTITD